MIRLTFHFKASTFGSQIQTQYRSDTFLYDNDKDLIKDYFML